MQKKTVLYIGFEVWFKTTTEIFATLFFFSFLYYFFCFVWLAACKESALFIDCNLCYVSIRMKEEKSNIKTINSHVCIHKYARGCNGQIHKCTHVHVVSCKWSMREPSVETLNKYQDRVLYENHNNWVECMCGIEWAIVYQAGKQRRSEMKWKKGNTRSMQYENAHSTRAKRVLRV